MTLGVVGHVFLWLFGNDSTRLVEHIDDDMVYIYLACALSSAVSVCIYTQTQTLLYDCTIHNLNVLRKGNIVYCRGNLFDGHS